MPPLFTIPHFSWLRRLSIVMAVALLGTSVLSLLGWALEVDELLQLTANSAPVQPNAALGFGVLALAFLGYESGYRRVALLALLPSALGVLVLLQPFVPATSSIDELFFKDHLQLGGGLPGRMPAICALCFILAGAALTYAGLRPLSPRRLALGLAGSILTSVGFSTIMANEAPDIQKRRR